MSEPRIYTEAELAALRERVGVSPHYYTAAEIDALRAGVVAKPGTRVRKRVAFLVTQWIFLGAMYAALHYEFPVLAFLASLGGFITFYVSIEYTATTEDR
jgi:hypothetical protein